MKVSDTQITDWQVQCLSAEQNNFRGLRPAIQNITQNPQITHIRIQPATYFNQQYSFAALV